MDMLQDWTVLRLVTLGLAVIQILGVVLVIRSFFTTKSDLAGRGLAQAYGVILIILTIIFLVPALILVLGGNLITLALILTLVPFLALLVRLVV
ncbi:hypothetical protein D3874_11615 [Oleomonas cavernae]|uniref:Uncharacterized protein n=1 Tax=Oleomonas cavernae TaxID=2320859 RepID=A0A418WC72_9PROT|nr:hypothetical protein [Oleomonas cavernae]RJF87589.1 hypothetical protein D3874_11615 [Oleomonas cavernae]